ncbi:ferredoxin [Streptantibioticus ferralitis]|uniref:Ferredoxin n=1 Tax=Streptantibioticus ferralitis TaxID=236510 RepID=A0ABT5Z405_9ACTN|nr:ferredoxin [Streptantibioticus ferralitis]MDF2258562.1 ferredoxin [Streptantibioticus ferralitis]
MRVITEEDKCCGSGLCVIAAPELFDQRDSDGVVVVLDETPGADRHDAVRKAVAACPAAAIRLARQ